MELFEDVIQVFKMIVERVGEDKNVVYIYKVGFLIKFLKNMFYQCLKVGRCVYEVKWNFFLLVYWCNKS